MSANTRFCVTGLPRRTESELYNYASTEVNVTTLWDIREVTGLIDIRQAVYLDEGYYEDLHVSYDTSQDGEWYRVYNGDYA